MPDTVACSAELVVDGPRPAALALFTALGEREWAHGWNPTFPAEGRTEGRGAVFITTGADHTTTWVMVDQDDHGVRYARVTPGATAGTVAVIVVEADATRTRLRVEYDLTALSADGSQWLDIFAKGFADYIAHWQTAITQHHNRPPCH